MDICPPLASSQKKKTTQQTSSVLRVSIKRKGWAGILPYLASVGVYKLPEVFYSAYQQSIKALKYC